MFDMAQGPIDNPNKTFPFKREDLPNIPLTKSAFILSVTINRASFNAGKGKREKREIENLRVGEGVQEQGGEGGTADR